MNHGCDFVFLKKENRFKNIAWFTICRSYAGDWWLFISLKLIFDRVNIVLLWCRQWDWALCPPGINETVSNSDYSVDAFQSYCKCTQTMDANSTFSILWWWNDSNYKQFELFNCSKVDCCTDVSWGTNHTSFLYLFHNKREQKRKYAHIEQR